MILGTEINEFVTNRQLSKIHFLQQENASLQEYISDLENALKLNKQAMQITIENFTQQRKQDQSNSLSSTIYSHSDSKLQFEKYEQIIRKLNEENTKLIETLSKTHKNSTTITTKSLLQEQIAEETQNFYKDLIHELEDKLIELKRNIHDKEYAIQELERMKPIQEREGQMIKFIEIVTPSEQTLKLHDEIENIRQVMNKVTQDAQSINEQNKILRDVNYNLKREVYKLRIVLRSQVAHQIMKNFIYNEYIENTDQNLQLNQEIQFHRPKLDQLHQEMYGQKGLGYGFSTEPQQIKYLSKNERMIYQEKLHKMEMMLKGFKELFEKEKVVSQQLLRKFQECKEKETDILDTNELLIKSNKLKDERIEKLTQDLSFCKKQANQYMELLKSRRPNYSQGVQLNQQQDIAVGIFSPRTQNSQINEHQSSSKKQSIPLSTRKLEILSSRQDYNDKKFFIAQGPSSNHVEREIPQPKSERNLPPISKMHKKPMLQPLNIEESNSIPQAPQCMTSRDANQNRALQRRDPASQYYEMTLQECKNFLISMANEFNRSYGYQLSTMQKISLMNQINDVSGVRKLKRSNSDPFGYFSKEIEEEKIVFKKPLKNFSYKNEIQMILEEIHVQKKQPLKKQDYEDPFHLDMSNIEDRKAPGQYVQEHPVQSTRVKRNVQIDADLSFMSNRDEDENYDNEQESNYE